MKNNAEFLRFDMSKSQRTKHYRQIKLEKRDWYKQLQKETLREIEECRE